MKEQIEEFAQDLLDNTKGGGLKWRLVPPSSPETYEADLDEGYSFRISRTEMGDDKYFNLELYGPSGLELAGQANNVIQMPTRATLQSFPKIGEDVSIGDLASFYGPDYERFRLFSSLFEAAQSSGSEASRPVIDKVAQLLKKRA
jgi:hypothetical protein